MNVKSNVLNLDIPLIAVRKMKAKRYRPRLSSSLFNLSDCKLQYASPVNLIISYCLHSLSINWGKIVFQEHVITHHR